VQWFRGRTLGRVASMGSSSLELSSTFMTLRGGPRGYGCRNKGRRAENARCARGGCGAHGGPLVDKQTPSRGSLGKEVVLEKGLYRERGGTGKGVLHE